MRLGALLVLAAAAVIGVAPLVLAAAFPALAAVACPACLGFRSLHGHVYVDRRMPADGRVAAVTIVAAARRRVTRFYGTLAGDPRIFICASDVCYDRVGGGRSHGMAILDLALFLSPRGATETIAAHELSHIELHARIGRLATLRRDVPQWFDEGVAVVVSDDPRYLAPASHAADRCRVAPDGDLPATRGAWVETAEHAALYAKAACRVSRWIAAKRGATAVTRLADAVARGTPFAAAYQ